METINTIELNDEEQYPDAAVLKTVLEESFPVYEKLLTLFNDYDMHSEWRYYHDGKAWLCKVQKKKRTIVWMSAWKGFMQATIYLPARYLERVYEMDISEGSKERIRSTRNVGKSKPCIFEIRTEAIINDLEKVMRFKIETK